PGSATFATLRGVVVRSSASVMKQTRPFLVGIVVFGLIVYGIGLGSAPDPLDGAGPPRQLDRGTSAPVDRQARPEVSDPAPRNVLDASRDIVPTDGGNEIAVPDPLTDTQAYLEFQLRILSKNPVPTGS